MENLDFSAQSKIIAIGGGKGGVGKSVVTANLAAGLVKAGDRVIAVDLDLGGPNLHTFFGFRKLPHGLFDFIIRNKRSLADVACDTKIPGLKIIGISEDYPGAANISLDWISKLMSCLKKLDADYILLDLGSGTTANVVDFFCVADQGIIVTSPEITSILNAYGFVKSVLFRRMDKIFEIKGKEKLRKIIKNIADPENEMDIKRVSDMENELIKADPESEQIVTSIRNQFKAKLILNMMKKSTEDKIGDSIKNIIKYHLNIDIEYLGSIVKDDAVEKSVIKMVPFLWNFPTSSASHCVNSITYKIRA